MLHGGRLTNLVFALTLTSCAHAKIADTEIKDTPENREVLAFVEQFRQAVENLDAEAVLALVSPDFFYEDNGNTDSSDDYGYEGLRSNLVRNFDRTQALQLKLRIDAVEVKEDSAYAELYFEYRAHNRYPAGDKWDTSTDRTRLQLVRDPEGQWRISGGL
ncbi:MAG: nuclear transport factor 2 family protein [Myxococcales bacterium]|nr:nuclear transport factor 2 family protein [Myxococcales bacterium]